MIKTVNGLKINYEEKGEGELIRFEEALGLVGKRDRAERLFREGEQIGDGEAKRIITELSEIYS